MVLAYVGSHASNVQADHVVTLLVLRGSIGSGVRVLPETHAAITQRSTCSVNTEWARAASFRLYSGTLAFC